MNLQFRRACAVLALLAATVPQWCPAKGPTVQVSISGPGIGLPIHTSDPAAIAPSAWGGEFALASSGAVVARTCTCPAGSIAGIPTTCSRSSAAMKACGSTPSRAGHKR